MTTEKCRVLCVDDDREICELVCFMFGRRGYEVTTASTPEEALGLSGRGRFDLIILDYHYPGMTGVEACREMRGRGDKTPVIFFTGEAHDAEREEALEAGAQAYLVKPGDVDVLVETAAGLVEGCEPSPGKQIPE